MEVIANPGEWNPQQVAGRWSLAGAQPKLALYRTIAGGWARPTGGTPTNAVLKPASHVPDLALNEYLSLLTAQHLGLRTAKSELLTLPHAKNYSIVMWGRQAVLAPLYDVASWALIPQDDAPAYVPMNIGGKYRTTAIGESEWKKAAGQLDLNPSSVLETVARIQSGLVDAYTQAAASLVDQVPHLSDRSEAMVAAIRRHASHRGWDP